MFLFESLGALVQFTSPAKGRERERTFVAVSVQPDFIAL
jgi:hypothetical protein